MKNQKHLFNIRDGVHYLNCAYKGPLLKYAESIAIQSLIKSRTPSDFIPEDFFRETEEVRKLFSSLVNSIPSQIAIIPSASYGFSSALNNIKGKMGQHALTIENEFPSIYFSLERWCKNNGIDLKVISPDKNSTPEAENWNNKIIDAINNKTSVVAISSIHWMNGLKFDLEKIGEKCKKVGAKLLVDGTQSVGAAPMDLSKINIDALICAGYKWLLGPYSLGLAFYSDYFNDGIPIEESWMNRTNAQNFSELTNYDPNYTLGAGRYNVGETSNFTSMAMLNASLTQINEWTVPGIELYTKKLLKPLLDYLTNLGIESENSKYSSKHLIGIKLPQNINHELLQNQLTKNQVFISQRGNFMRISANVFNTQEDIDALILSLKQTLE